MKPPTTLLMGGVGTGKTTSLVTYLEAGLKLAVVINEPDGEGPLVDAITRAGLPLDNLHTCYVPFARTDWETLQTLITNVNRMNFKDLADLKGIKKTNYRQMFELYDALTNFKDDRTGEEFGPVEEFDDTWALSIDSTTGLNTMCRTLVVGAKPAPSIGEWGVMMNVQTAFVDKLTSDLNCFFALTAHVSKTFVEAEGRVMLTPMCVTKSLGDVIPRMFSDVVMAKREGATFYWSTVENNADLKFRNLEPSNTLPPSFVPIVEAYRKRQSLVQPSADPAPQEVAATAAPSP